MTTDYISLKNYYVKNGLQYAEVEANVTLVNFNGNKCKKSSETIKMLLTKSAACKTQVVCGPSIMRCRGCGKPMTLLEGRICRQCGTDIYLERFDWVIREYNLIK